MKRLITTTNVIVLALVVMVCLNLFSLYMLHTAKQEMRAERPPAGRGRKEPKYLIIDRLGFSKEQIDEYETLISEHRSVVEPARRKIRELKRELYGLLYLPVDDPKVQKIIGEILLRERRIEEATFEHFREVRAICTDEQKKEFDRIINRVLEGMDAGRPPHRPPPPPPPPEREWEHP